MPCDRTLKVMKTNDDAGPVVEAPGDRTSQTRSEPSRLGMVGPFTRQAWRRQSPRADGFDRQSMAGCRRNALTQDLAGTPSESFTVAGR